VGAESCNGAGTCVAKPPLAGGTDDGDPCTKDSCDPARGIVNERIPGCGVVAPGPGDETVPSTFEGSTDFLTRSGGQAGVSIVPRRRAVVRGFARALAQDGTVAKKSGIEVSIKDHPEYKSVTTDANGAYALAVDGGGELVVRLTEKDHLPAERMASTYWHKYTVLDDVALVALDLAVTEVVPRSPTSQLAWGTRVGGGAAGSAIDSTPSRRPLLVVPPNTAISTTGAPAGAFHVRMTEYTAFREGVRAMPASLPANSGYTYAVEMMVDELRGKGVAFDKPLSFYLDDFLELPEGEPVPTGTYDPTLSAWVPDPSGKVIRIVGISPGGEAIVSASSSGGVVWDAGELASLALAYRTDVCPTAQTTCAEGSAGVKPKQLWRVKMAHFSTKDHNWGISLPAGAVGPTGSGAGTGGGSSKNTCEQAGSVIECQNQVLGEVLPIAGSAYSLTTWSDRTLASRLTLRVKLSDAQVLTPPPERVEADIYVAGQRHHFERPYAPNDQLLYVWDRKDAFGRPWEGSATADVRVRYIYKAGLGTTPDFGSFPTQISVAKQERQGREIALERRHTVVLGNRSARGMGLGGWNISAQGMSDPEAGIYFLGQGGRIHRPPQERRIVGGARPVATQPSLQDGTIAAGGNAVGGLDAFAYAPDGTLYFGNARVGAIRAVDPSSGLLSTIAGGEGSFPWPSAAPRQVPARSLQFSAIDAMTMDRTGNLYVLMPLRNVIVKLAPSAGAWVASVAAGNPLEPRGITPDGTPAAWNRLDGPYGLAVAEDGTIVFAEQGTRSVRRIDSAGILRTIVGGNPVNSGCAIRPDQVPSSGAEILTPVGVAIGRDGTVFLGEGRCSGGDMIRALRPSGVLERFAGGTNNQPFQPLERGGGPAVATAIDSLGQLLASRDGRLYYTDTQLRQVRRIEADGTVTEFAGRQVTPGAPEVPDTALGTDLGQVRHMAEGPDGELVTAVRFSVENYIGTFAVPDGDTRVVVGGAYHEIRGGRHVRTIDRLRGLTLETLDYDASGLVAKITDANGLATTFARASNTVTITAPHGQKTVLTLDSNGYLASVKGPDNVAVNVKHDAKGLLTDLLDGRGQAHHYEYDAEGLVVKDVSPDAAPDGITLASTARPDWHSVTHTTAGGRKTTYESDSRPSSAAPDREELLTVTVSPRPGVNETSTEVRSKTSGSTVRLPNGTVVVTTRQSDPKDKMEARYVGLTTVTSGGHTARSTQSRTVTATTRTTTQSVAGGSGQPTLATWSTVFDASANTMESISPLGRGAVVTFDPTKNRMVSARVKGTVPVSLTEAAYTYDSEGRVTKIAIGQRAVSFGYGVDGFLSSVVGPTGTTTVDARDAVGRVLRITQPGNRTTSVAYDANGNPVSVTPPGRTAHTFGFNLGDLVSTYTPPDVGQNPRTTSFAYDKDQLPTQETTPAVTSTFGFDGTKRLVTRTDGARSVLYERLPGGRVQRAVVTAATGNVADEVSYFDALPSGDSLILGGAAPVTRTWEYDDLFRATATTFAGIRLPYAFDADGSVSTVGALSVVRGNTMGMLVSAALGRATEAFSYDTYGAPLSMVASWDGSPRGGGSLSYETTTGRILGKTETWSFPGVQAAPSKSWTYTYDVEGRLASASDGGATATYAYDAAGNRAGATVDAQDRVTRQGDTAYTYDASGMVTTRTVSGQASQAFAWDARGSLLSVAQAPAPSVAYDVDAAERRVAKRRNGTRTRIWRYAGQLNIEAEVVAPESGAPSYRMYGYIGDRFLPVVMQERTALGESKTYRIYGDHLGSLRAVVDVSTGEAVQTMAHDPWGKVTHDAVAPGFERVPFGYAGGLYDEDTGLSRFGAREYDATTGRWLSKDEAGFAGGANFYLYANDNPVSYVDRDGKFPIPAIIALVVVLGMKLSSDQAEVQQASHEGSAWDLLDLLMMMVPGSGSVAREIAAASSEAKACKAAAAEAAAAENAAMRVCFPAGTLIATPDGPKTIESLQKGDVVLSWDFEQEKRVDKPISATFHRTSEKLVRVALDTGDTIEATESHPFWVVGVGWVRAGELKPDTSLRGLDGLPKRIVAIGSRLGPVAVYNLEIQGPHNYYAGHEPVLVHNQDVVNTDFNRATNVALEWLQANGVNTAKVSGPWSARFGPDKGSPIGVRFEGGGGYRIEFDARSGAHINVEAGKLKGPHIQFEGNQKTVNTLVRRLFRC